MSRLPRTEAVGMQELITSALRRSALRHGFNNRRIFEAWDEASGAGQFTSRRFFRDGKLYITLQNSVIRSQLYFQKDILLAKINRILEGDVLFLKDDNEVGKYVKELILK